MKIKTHKDLQVYSSAMQAAMDVFDLSKRLPSEERYALTDQVRRSSRSVCANLAEAWRKRRYQGAFVAKLSDSESEAAETQAWIEIAVRCGYWTKEEGRRLYAVYNAILRTLVGMINHPKSWILKR